ncbi:hypothetical protein F441_00676 [Phytophthora nicotianae CJ01A1]|uniref:Uncharacterized protein n=1 Tax=Phytophthora nicotianae CJ01A1 TaxID=1317063 RepID=W2XW56_PHYNI|nr:hypothetical protein F441_00676 [Phytophthora nicotianae CJ01A1]
MWSCFWAMNHLRHRSHGVLPRIGELQIRIDELWHPIIGADGPITISKSTTRGIRTDSRLADPPIILSASIMTCTGSVPRSVLRWRSADTCRATSGVCLRARLASGRRSLEVFKRTASSLFSGPGSFIPQVTKPTSQQQWACNQISCHASSGRSRSPPSLLGGSRSARASVVILTPWPSSCPKTCVLSSRKSSKRIQPSSRASA